MVIVEMILMMALVHGRRLIIILLNQLQLSHWGLNWFNPFFSQDDDQSDDSIDGDNDDKRPEDNKNPHSASV